MLLAMILQVGGLLFVAAAMALAVHVTSPASNPRRHRATIGSMVMIVLLMGALATVIRGMAYLGLPTVLAGWLVYVALHFFIYGVYLGLGSWRALLMGPAKWLSFWLFDVIARWLTGPAG